MVGQRHAAAGEGSTRRAVSNPPQVDPPPRDASEFSPVYVLAPARSHSSVVATMIGQHPQLFGFPELCLYRHERIGKLLFDPPGWNGQPARRRLAGLLRALAYLHHGEQTNETITEAYRWLRRRRAWSPADLYDHLLGQIKPRIGVEKSPDNSGRAANFSRLIGSYPSARYIHLVRHPMKTMVSMHEAWSSKPYWKMPPELFHQFCLGNWYFHHARIRAFTSSLPADQWLLVRSENVLNDPDRELVRICRWLQVDAGRHALDAMRHPERSPFAGLGPGAARGGNDPKFLRDPELRPAPIPPSLAFPSEWVLDPWTVLAATELAQRFGYYHVDEAGN